MLWFTSEYRCLRRRWTSAVCLIVLTWNAGCAKTVDTKDKTSSNSADKPVSPAKATYPVAEATLNTIELTEDAVRRLGIEAQPLTERSMPRFRTYGAEAVLPAGASVIVSAPVAGTLRIQSEREMLLPGQQVVKDSKLLELLPMLSPERDVLTPAERIRFAEVKSTIAQSQNDAAAQVQQCQVQVEAAQIALDRAERLLKDKSGTIRTVDEATAQLRLAEAALEAAKARKVIVDGITLDAEAGTRQPIPIVAPMSGLLRSVQVQPGQITAAGSPMFEIMNTSTLWVRAPIYVGDLESLKLTANAQVSAPGERFQAGSVSVKPINVPPTAQALASTVDVYYELPNDPVKYRPGQRFSVQIQMTGDAMVPAVPWSAVYLDVYGNQWIYEKTGDRTFVRRRVEVAFVADGWAALNQGPDAGVSVVTTAVAELAGTEFGFAK